jgi:phosphoribosyl 1,2-cyclic phosphodiesterase
MRIAILGSGSRGNAMVLESGGHRLLVDAGFSCRELERRMALLDIAADSLSGLLLTHEHSDHVQGADVLTRRYGLPVYATEGTLDGAKLAPEVRKASHRLASGVPAEVAGFRVEPFAVPHDAAEPVGFTVEDSAGHRVGLAADLGSRSRLAWGRMTELDCLVLETNHDLGMLRNGPYPWHLKQRVAGSHGHLSNEDAAGGIAELVTDRLRWVVCYHLSRTNNSPALAADAVGEALDREGCRARVELTWQDRPTGWIELDRII